MARALNQYPDLLAVEEAAEYLRISRALGYQIDRQYGSLMASWSLLLNHRRYWLACHQSRNCHQGSKWRRHQSGPLRAMHRVEVTRGAWPVDPNQPVLHVTDQRRHLTRLSPASHQPTVGTTLGVATSRRHRIRTSVPSPKTVTPTNRRSTRSRVDLAARVVLVVDLERGHPTLS